MVENYFFKGKWRILAIFRKIPLRDGKNRYKDSLFYISYNIPM